MPTIIRKGFRLAVPLAATARRSGVCNRIAALACATLFLCAAQIAAAVPEAVPAGSAQEQDEGANISARHRATPAAKRTIALAQFDVANTQHVDDIDNVYDGLPLALASRLEAGGEFLTRYTGRSIPAETGEARRKAITLIAGEAGAQFLISGMVVNAGTKLEKGYLGTSIGESAKRHIEVDLAVYDGLSGARLLHRRLGEQTEGDVRVGNDKPFGSSIFFETGLGQALDRLLDRAVGDIRAALENVPFSAHIVRVEGGRVFLDAGSDALLKPGDKLVAYVSDAAPVVGLKGALLGTTERAMDLVTLTRAEPRFAIGELSEDAAKHGIRAGSIVRIDPVEQRSLLAKQIAAQQAARAEQEARAEAERQAAQAEAARLKAEQEAKAEAERIKAEKLAEAQARAKAAAEAKAARLKVLREARAARLKAAREARARELARERARAAAEARAARLKAEQEAEAEAARIEAEKKAQEKAAAQPVVEEVETKVESASSVVEIEWSDPKKRATPLKLKQIKP